MGTTNSKTSDRDPVNKRVPRRVFQNAQDKVFLKSKLDVGSLNDPHRYFAIETLWDLIHRSPMSLWVSNALINYHIDNNSSFEQVQASRYQNITSNRGSL